MTNSPPDLRSLREPRKTFDVYFLIYIGAGATLAVLGAA